MPTSIPTKTHPSDDMSGRYVGEVKAHVSNATAPAIHASMSAVTTRLARPDVRPRSASIPATTARPAIPRASASA